MLPSLVLAAANLTTAFLNDFRGTWNCRSAAQRSHMNVYSPDGRYWTVVVWNDGKTVGTAYVGYVKQQQRFFYNDYRDDGTFARLTSPLPVEHRWHWTGNYYPANGGAPDALDVVWTLTPRGTIVRQFEERSGTRVIRSRGDVCSKS